MKNYGDRAGLNTGFTARSRVLAQLASLAQWACHRDPGCLPLTKSFQKIRSENKRNMSFVSFRWNFRDNSEHFER